MTITQATKKKLFGTSGNQCAFPDCEREVVDLEEDIVIGEIAHIHARREKGPRFKSELDEDERDEVSNLMIMCPTHHTIIDQNPEKYSATKLKRWKRRHEEKVSPLEISDEILIEQLKSTSNDPIKQLEKWKSVTRDEWRDKTEEEFGSVGKSPYKHGCWIFSYKVIGEFDKPNVRELLDILREVKGIETGWPPWLGIDKYGKPSNGEIEAWLIDSGFDDPAHKDFWRASPEGNLFLLRGYTEDAKDEYPPGDILDFLLPILNIGECVLHANRLSRKLAGDHASIAIDVNWENIDGRELDSMQPRAGIWPPDDRKAHQKSASFQGTFPISQIESELPSIVEEITKPLYHAFDFYEPSEDLILRQLGELRGYSIEQ